MKTIEEIKNKFAKNNSYNNWSEFMLLNSRNSILIEKAMDEIIMLVQKEQQKLIAENADTKMERYNDLQDVIVVDKYSIINENNIIK